MGDGLLSALRLFEGGCMPEGGRLDERGCIDNYKVIYYVVMEKDEIVGT